MKNLPTAPAPAGLARRSFLTGLAVTLPIAAAVAAPALATPGASRTEIDGLYAERTELAARSRALHEAYVAAEASMPWWAQAGHEFLRRDGTWTGAIVGWPAICDADGGIPSIRFTRMRPSPSDIRQDCEELVRRLGESKRSAVRGEYRRRMRELIARLRRQREEGLKAGMPGMEAELDAIGQQISQIDDKVKNLDVSAADVAQKAAAVHMITMQCRHSIGEVAVLMALRPMLTGLIREHADFAAKDRDAPVDTMPFWADA